MTQGLRTHGFTIVESLIFLAVAGGLVSMAFLFINGQSVKTQFSQSIRDVQQQIDGVIDNVSSGYYASSNNFTCTATSDTLTISSVSSTRGTNKDCMFVGRAMQFWTNSSSNQIFTYDIVSRRISKHFPANSGVLPTSLDDANPAALAPTDSRIGHTGTPDLHQVIRLLYGLNTVAVKYNGASQDTRGVAIVSSFDGDSLAKGSGARTALLYVLRDVAEDGAYDGNVTQQQMASLLDDAQNFISPSDVTICFKGVNNKYGLITIGGNGGQLSTKLDIFNNIGSVVPSGACS